MYAAALGSLDAVKLLVEAGAKVNTANDFGATPLMWCAGDLAKVRYLLSKGADVKARSKVGRTPLAIAAAYDGSVEIARLMIEKGADVKAEDESGMSVLESPPRSTTWKWRASSSPRAPMSTPPIRAVIPRWATLSPPATAAPS